MSGLSPPTVIRVRGLPITDHSAAEAAVRKAMVESSAEAAVRKAIADSCGRQEVKCKVSIVPACDEEDELVALVDFAGGLPDFLSSLNTNPSKSYEVPTDDEDLTFDKHFNGFTQLYNVADENDIHADVIAICGIGGHAYGSWQGRGNTRRMWLRHFLARDLKSCRVMTYGYSAKLTSHGFATAEDYANQFLEDLKRVRTKEALLRPLIFVAHSFGGLILARSLIKAVHTYNNDRPAISSMHRATYGMLLFAVPHRGLDVEDMRRIMGEEQHSRADLLDQISNDSSRLRTQLADFKDILWDRKVVTFFETEQSRRLQRTENGEWKRTGDYFTSLETESAILELPSQIETRVALHCDHSAVVKFDTRHSDGYKHAVDHLQDFARIAPQVVSQRFQLSDPLSTPMQSMQNLTITRQMSDTPVQSEGAVNPGHPAKSTERIEEQDSDETRRLRKLHSLAVTYAKKSKWEDAASTYLKALSGREKLLGADHADTLHTVHKLGVAYDNLERYTEAETLLHRALSARRKTLGPDHIDTLRTLHFLGVVYADQDKNVAAQDMFREALAGRERTLGLEHSETVKSMQSLGNVYLEQERLSEAETIFAKVLSIRESKFGAEDVDTLRVMHDLGLVRSRQERYPEAIEILKRTLTGRENTLPPGHYSTADTLYELGYAYYDDGKEAESVPCFERALPGFEKKFGLEHKETLSLIHKLGLVYRDVGRYEDAHAMFCRALAGRENSLGLEHKLTKKSRTRRDEMAAKIQEQKGKNNPAREFWNKLVKH